jgi:L-malate glycosyltransferase
MNSASTSKRHVLHVFATFVPAGPQTRTANVLEALGSSWRHTIVAMDNRTSASELLAEDLEITLRDAPPQAGFFKTLRALRTMIQEVAPDLICTYNWGAIETVLAVRSLTGIPLIHHEEGFGPEEAASFKKRRVWMRRFLFKRVPALIVPSHNLGKIARDLWRVPERQLHIVPNGVHLSRFGPRGADMREQLALPPDAVVVGSVGHLRPEKNYGRLIEAMASATARTQVPLHLVLVGDGVERSHLEELAQTLGLKERVHFTGHQENTAPAYRTFDIFCLSSDTEQMPISLIEAMATGIPPVATDVGDIRLMVPTESRANIVSKDLCPLALADQLVLLANDKDVRMSLGRAAEAKARELYGFDKMLAIYKGLYESLLF